MASAVALGAAGFVAATLGVLTVVGRWRGPAAADVVVLLAPAAAAVTGGVLAAWWWSARLARAARHAAAASEQAIADAGERKLMEAS